MKQNKVLQVAGIIILSLLILLCSLVAVAKGNKDVITLTLDNVITLRGEVSQDSVTKWSFDLNSKPAGSQVYLFLDSPGGDVTAAAQFIASIRSSDKKITCIASFAASAMFMILQACPERNVMEYSILMQHLASIGLPPAQMPNQASVFGFFQRIIANREKEQANRMGLSVETFRDLIRADLWLFGDESIGIQAADKVVKVTCNVALTQKTYVEEVFTIFGAVNLSWSFCPILSTPLGVLKPKTPEAVQLFQDWLKYRDRDNILKVNLIKGM